MTGAGDATESAGRPTTPVNRWLVAILLLATGALLYQTTSQFLTTHWGGSRLPAPRGELLPVEQAMIEVYNDAALSVVSISSLGLEVDPERRVSERETSHGSGVVWDAAGHIVTNNHVIGQSDGALVVLADQSTCRARVVGRAPELDLAVIKVDAPAELLQPIRLGTSDDLLVGQQVIAIGNPAGLSRTMTTGIISGLGRTVASSQDGRFSANDREAFRVPWMIQTDASINPGNSGGPLLDSSGRMIGINSHVLQLGGTSGAGLAIPIDFVAAIVPTLIEHGTPARAGLGVVPHNQLDVEFLLSLRAIPQRGVLVQEILRDGAADQSGLRPSQFVDGRRPVIGDLIIAFDGNPITTARELAEQIAGRAADEVVTLTVLRNGRPLEVDVRLQVVPYGFML